MKRYTLATIIFAFLTTTILPTALTAQDTDNKNVHKPLNNVQINKHSKDGQIDAQNCSYYLEEQYYLPDGVTQISCYSGTTSLQSSAQCGSAICTGTQVTFFCNGDCVYPIAGLNIYNGQTGIYVGAATSANAYTFNTSGLFSASFVDGMGNQISGLNFVVTVSAPPTAVFNISPSNVVCEGDPITLTLVGPSPDSYGWGGVAGGVCISGLNQNVYTIPCGTLALGVNQVSLKESNGGTVNLNVPVVGCPPISGCTYVDSQDITVVPIQPVFTYTTTCGSNTVSFANNSQYPSPTDPNFTWQWSVDGIIVSTAANIGSYTFSSVGTYIVTLNAVPTAGCGINSVSTTHIITVGNPVISLSGKPACPSLSSGSMSVTATGGASPYTYLWVPTNSTLSSITNLAPGAYSVTVTDANGCKVTASGRVVTDLVGLLSISPSTPAICKGGQLSITASGANEYTWSPGTALNSSTGVTVIATPTSTTNYTVTSVADANGCKISLAFSVGVYPIPTVTVSPTSNAICSGGTVITGSGSNISSYSWSPATVSCTSCASAVATPTTNTVYTLTAYSPQNACSATSTTTIYYGAPTAPVVTGGTTRLCPSTDISLNAIAPNANSYTWKILSEPKSGDFSLQNSGPYSYNDLSTEVYSTAVTVEAAGINACGTGTYGTYHTSSLPESSCLEKSPELNGENQEDITKVYPNPANSLLHVEIQLQSNETENLCVYNIMGEQVKCFQLTYNISTISVESMPAGMYFYRITDNSGNLIKSEKIIIIH